MTKLHELHDLGQSTWLNYMRRRFIVSGGLREAIDQGIQGITASAAVFEETIRDENEYDDDIHRYVVAGVPTTRIHERLMADDVQRAADLLHPVFEESDGLDGVASLEIDPALADDGIATVATVRRLLALVDRGNAMVEIPSTHAGSEAILDLVADGININATHIFSVSAFERVAQAYISGLERYLDTHSVWRTAPTAVASFSVGPIDQAVDERLAAKGHPELRGRTAIAVGRVLYGRFCDIFSGPRWEALARRGAQPLRPKWTRLSALDEQQAGTAYIDALIGRNTVLTFTPQTLALFQQEGSVVPTLECDRGAAEELLARLAGLDIDLEQIAEDLQAAHLAAADRQYQALVVAVIQKLVAEAPHY